jgi:pimeloyl-ACP methyl ester carboxylesterase
MTEAPNYLDGPHGRIAWRGRKGIGPGVVWLGGFRSDMQGTKATFLDEWAKHHNRDYLRFDYSGHGESDGLFEDGSIGAWSEDALAAFDELTKGPQILVGSSMGAWIATLLALKRTDRIAGIVFIAPAPDFTEALMMETFSKEDLETLHRDRRLEKPSDNSDEPDLVTLKMIEDGREHLVMTGPIPLHCPIRVLQGMKDEDVPWQHAVKFASMLESADVEILMTKNGDHRLSTPDDLARLAAALEAFEVLA